MGEAEAPAEEEEGADWRTWLVRDSARMGAGLGRGVSGGLKRGWAERCGSWAVRGETRAARERAERAGWKGLSAGKAARGANWAVGKKGEGMTGPG